MATASIAVTPLAVVAKIGKGGKALQAESKLATHVETAMPNYLPNQVTTIDVMAPGGHVRNLIPVGKAANHLFTGKPGKLTDTPANRTLIENLSNGTPVVIDPHGKAWYAGVDAAGRPIYSYTQNGVVKGAGYLDMTVPEMIKKYGSQ